MTAENFLEQGNVYTYATLFPITDISISYWGAIEGAVSLLVASLPVIGGRMISKWRHIFIRSTNAQSLNLSKSLRNKTRGSTFISGHSVHDMNDSKFPNGTFSGGEKTIETVVSAGSTLAEGSTHGSEEEPVSLMQHMARMGRRASRDDHHSPQPQSPNGVTVRKEVYIREEHTGDARKGDDNNV